MEHQDGLKLSGSLVTDIIVPYIARLRSRRTEDAREEPVRLPTPDGLDTGRHCSKGGRGPAAFGARDGGAHDRRNVYPVQERERRQVAAGRRGRGVRRRRPFTPLPRGEALLQAKVS